MIEKDYIAEIENLLKGRKKRPVEVLNTILGFLNFSDIDIKIYNLLLKTSLNIKDIEKQLNLSERTIRKYIKRLYKEGLIIRKVKEGKRLKYIYSAVPIQMVWKKVKNRIQNIINNISEIVENKNIII
jgi:predicted transcriptional regulator